MIDNRIANGQIALTTEANMKFLFATILGLGSLLTAAPLGLAQDLTCNFSSSSFMTIAGNLVVPDNAICMLTGGGTVSGNISVGANAGLDLEGNWLITGYLHANNCSYVSLNPYGSSWTVIGGNVQIENCSGNSPKLGLYFPAGAAFGGFGPNSLIGGSFECYDNAGPCILVNDHVGGNIHVWNNKSSVPSQIVSNFVAKGIHCKNNVPAPTGSANVVAGNPNKSSEGQCQNF
jgi:hypothetical protein